mmetsp:Transcript_49658/g.99653  ORF Transcript_49658/g.99653 Transcript_49658/m.99653 type:complete len:207 (-) Transcript_49658:433-1053(-)
MRLDTTTQLPSASCVLMARPRARRAKSALASTYRMPSCDVSRLGRDCAPGAVVCCRSRVLCLVQRRSLSAETCTVWPAPTCSPPAHFALLVDCGNMLRAAMLSAEGPLIGAFSAIASSTEASLCFAKLAALVNVPFSPAKSASATDDRENQKGRTCDENKSWQSCRVASRNGQPCCNRPPYTLAAVGLLTDPRWKHVLGACDRHRR